MCPETHRADAALEYLSGRVYYYDPVVHVSSAMEDYYPRIRRGVTAVPMSWCQTMQYLLYRAQTVTLGNVTIQSSKSNSYDALTRVISNKQKGTTAPSPKFRALVRRIIDFPHYPQVVYSHFRETGVDGIKTLLLRRWPNCRVIVLSGSTSTGHRKRITDKYNAGQVDVLFITDAAKEGIDLHNTRQMHLLEPHYNLQSENQTINRVVRYNSHPTAESRRNGVVVMKYISTFPTAEPNETQRAELEQQFRDDYLRNGDIEFDLLAALRELISTEGGVTVDERYEAINVSKQGPVDRSLQLLQLASI
jgi:hypothetical protein